MGGGPPKEVLLCVLPFPEPPALTAALKAKFPHLEITYHQTSFPGSTTDAFTTLSTVPADSWAKATILVTLATFPTLAQAPNLSYVHLISAGSNQIQKEKLYTETDVPITTSSGIHGPQIAEWAVLTRLVLSHKYHLLYELQKGHQWGGGAREEYHAVRDLVGGRVGILGYGSIGRQIGRVAKAMGMSVVAFTATPKAMAEERRDRGFIVPGTGDTEGEVPVEWYFGLDAASRREFLAQKLDWIVVCVPLTAETRHFLGKEEFDALSQNGTRAPFVTNIARGQIIDQKALVAALKDGRVGGAALDVTDPEPLPKESELWGMGNVIVTPHVSGVGEGYLERTFAVLELNLGRRERGEEMVNVVRRERGY